MELNYFPKPSLEVQCFRKAGLGERVTFLKDKNTKICRLLSKKKKWRPEFGNGKEEKEDSRVVHLIQSKGDPVLGPACA